jgi:hypothetical protein
MPHAKIATKQATYTLEQLHAELGGKIIDNKREGRRLVAAMKHVEAVLKLLDPAYSVRGLSVRRRKPNPWFKRGTVLRRVLDVLRAADGPMTAREIVQAMLVAKGIENAKPSDVRGLTGSVQACLQNHNGGTVRNVAEGMPGRWILS